MRESSVLRLPTRVDRERTIQVDKVVNHWARKLLYVCALLLIGLHGTAEAVYVEGNPLMFTDPEGLNPKGMPRKPIDLLLLDGGGGGGMGGYGGSGRSAGGKASGGAPQCPPGYDRIVKDPPFNPHGQKVYTDGKSYLTPDVDSHNGGVWKMFDRKGNRTGTYDADLNWIGK